MNQYLSVVHNEDSGADPSSDSPESSHSMIDHFKQAFNLGLSNSSVDLGVSNQFQFPDIEQSDEEEEYMKGYWLSDNPRLSKNLKVKLIITDTNDDGMKNLRRLLSPVMTAFDFSQKYGMFHTALVVGGFKLEWTSGGLCIPRAIGSQLSLLAVDVDEIATVGDFNSTVDILADVITRWNSSMEYNQNKLTSKSGNCQHFVEDLLSSLKINVEFSGPVQAYLKEMRTSGTCAMKFAMNDESFRTKFNIKETTIEFQTHEQLDTFVKSLIAIDPTFGKTAYIQEYQLLKGFDRALWMRHYDALSKSGTPNPVFKPITESECMIDLDTCQDKLIEKCTCPFNDPRSNMSFLYEKSFDFNQQQTP